jgi:hypothetical protein
MGVLKDIVELIKDIKDGTAELEMDSYDPRQKSLSRTSKDAVLQFPVIYSNTISIENVSMISKALERQYATFARLSMSLDDKIEDKDNKISYLKKFHQNTQKTSGGFTTSLIGTVRKLSDDNIILLKPYNGEINLSEENTDLELDTLNNLTVKNRKRNYFGLNEAEETKKTYHYDKSGKNPKLHSKEVFDKADPYKPDHQYKSPFKDQLLDNDVKKANELVPTTLDITVNYETKSGDIKETGLLVGVKTVSHVIPSEEMIFNLTGAVKEKRNLFRFFQWTTGEIEFLKDYVFSIDRIKREALSSRVDSPWWRALKRRAMVSNIRNFLNMKDRLLPNATLVITMEEVEYIINQSNINLLNDLKSVKSLIEIFFLLGFVIIDTSTEIVHFFFDGEEDYQTFSFASLEREARNSNNDIKSLVSLMNKR